jgi:hypothetical protein
VARRYQDTVPVVGMAGRDDTDAMQDFVDRHGLGFLDHSVDSDGSLWTDFGVRGQPAWVFIDRAGKTTVQFGALTERDLEARLDAIAES